MVEADKQLDRVYKTALGDVQDAIASSPSSNVPLIIEAVLVLKAVERIGDHAKNLAKHVIFQVEGIEVRHLKGQKLAEALGKASGNS